MTWQDVLAGITALIAIAAFFRPTVERFLQRRATGVRFVPGARLEIGFNGLGPNIGLVGALIGAGERRVFTNMRIEVRRARDDAKFHFDWLVFRPITLTASADKLMQESRIAHPVVSDEHRPEPLNVFLNDRRAAQVIEAQASRLAEAWRKHRNAQRLHPVNRDPALYSDEIFAMYSDWAKLAPPANEFWSAVQNEFNWKEGAYTAFVLMRTVAGNWERAGAFKFEISKEQSEKLKDNIFWIERLAAKDIVRDWLFEPAYVDLSPSEDRR